MKEQGEQSSTRPVCDKVANVACEYAGGEECGLEKYLEGVSPQIRAAMRARIRAQAARHPERVERRCREELQVGKIIVGVMGPGEGATKQDEEHAFAVGQLIAHNGWVLVTGGRPVGVMAAANRGAKEAGGLTVGILPSRTSTPENTSADVDIAIPTGLGDGRNAINVLTSDVVIGCGMGAGTASEIALALKAGKRVILLGAEKEAIAFFSTLGEDLVSCVGTAQEAITTAHALVTDQIRREKTKGEGRA